MQNRCPPALLTPPDPITPASPDSPLADGRKKIKGIESFVSNI
jgi:hypothetical protein